MCPLEAVEIAPNIQDGLQRANGEALIQTIKQNGAEPLSNALASALKQRYLGSLERRGCSLSRKSQLGVSRALT